MLAGHFYPRVSDKMIIGGIFPLLCLIDDVLGSLYKPSCCNAISQVNPYPLVIVTASYKEDFLLLLVLEESLVVYTLFLYTIRRML
jgi:hypothetical protein